MDFPTDRPASGPVATAARRTMFGFGVREIGVGVVALAVLAAAGLWWHGRFSRNQQGLATVRQQLAAREDAADLYRDRFSTLQWRAVQIHAWAEAQKTEPLRTWAKERAHEFDALVARVDREQQAHLFADASKDVEALCAKGDLEAARARLNELPDVTFPAPTEFGRLQHELYEAPLAQFSRQNPDFYRAFQNQEPVAAKQDQAVLRKEIAAASADGITPQVMLRVDLLAAVAPADDPVVAEWSSLANAMDYFENPDPATLAHWRRAQRALQTKDYQTATDEMQAIVIAKVRTRQPFRAALGRVLIKNRPDQPGEAYPYLAEAAAAGDKQARAWVAQQDFAQKRYAQAKRWMEAAVADGDFDLVPLLLQVYDQQPNEVPKDAAREAGVLEVVTGRPDAPAEASLLLGRLYERIDPVGPEAAKAFAAYSRAAAKGSAIGNAEVARCALRGVGTNEDLDQARDAACRAFSAGERDRSVPILIELMRRAPDRTAAAVAHLFGVDDVATPGAYTETTIVSGPGVEALKALLAAYFDKMGKFGSAARFYAGLHDPKAAHRGAELTATHTCDTCGGTGKIRATAPCPSCGGSGKQICSYCGGAGFIYIPGTPPCPTCGGSGTVVQDHKLVTCSTCGGTGKGKGSVIKQDCPHCDHGNIRCPECNGTGVITITKECPDCHGRGTWSLATQQTE